MTLEQIYDGVPYGEDKWEHISDKSEVVYSFLDMGTNFYIKNELSKWIPSGEGKHAAVSTYIEKEDLDDWHNDSAKSMHHTLTELEIEIQK